MEKYMLKLQLTLIKIFVSKELLHWIVIAHVHLHTNVFSKSHIMDDAELGQTYCIA